MPERHDSTPAQEPRFRAEAYLFVHEALACAQQMFKRSHHVTGQELCLGARQLALERYGQLARAVLNSWGIFTTDDLGMIVYGLIEAGAMSKTDTDRIEDFHSVFDFDEVFVRSYKLGSPTKRDDAV